MKKGWQVMFVVVALFLTLGAQAQVRIITAYETTGLNPDFTSLYDSGANPELLCYANENAAACVAAPYMVPSAMINPNFVVNGGSMGIDFIDNPNSDYPGTLSDQLYLAVGPRINGMNQLTWCWDSDLEPDINVCQNVINPQYLVRFVEPDWGVMDVTSTFTDPVTGLLAQGQWQVLALSEATPEPSTFLMLGSGILGLAGMLRRKLF